MRKIFRANLYFLLIMLWQIVGSVLISIAVYTLGISDIKIVLVLSHFITLIIPAILYFIITRDNIKKTLRLNKLKIVDALWVILLGFLCQPVVTFFSLITAFFFENNIGTLMNDIVQSPYIILLLLIAVMPAITEEVTIRGIVLSGYNNINKYKAAVITGLFFGMMHLDGQQFLYAAALGFIIALVVRITNSIFSGCLIHFIINGTSITLQKVLSLLPAELMQGAEGVAETSLINMPIMEKLIAFIIYGLIAVVFGTLIWLVIRALEKRNPEVVNVEPSISGAINKERIIDIPFILSIIIFLGFMALSIFVL